MRRETHQPQPDQQTAQSPEPHLEALLNHGRISVDAEFDQAESEADPLERAQTVRLLVDELLDGRTNLSDNGDYHLLEGIPPTVTEYVLPGIPNGTSDYDSIRPRAESSIYFETAERLITRLDQGAVVVCEPDKKAYLRAGLSQCSLIAAKDREERLYAAHISFSEQRQVEAVMQFLEQRGISPQEVKVIAALETEDRDHSYLGEGSKPAQLPDYQALRIPERNIHSFYYGAESGLQPNDWTHYNLAYGLVCPDFVFAYNFDAIEDYHRGLVTKSDYRNEWLRLL